MANNRYKIDIPTNPAEAIKLLGTIKKKHEDLGAASPLAGLKWATINPAHAIAEEQDSLSVDLRRKAEAATGARDVQMPLVNDAIRSARDVLMGLNRDNPDALGDFGFDVSDARSSKETPPPPTA